MAEIEFLLPTVQYGNLKVRATPEELGLDLTDAAGLGATYAVYLNAFTQGFKQGSQIDVTVDIKAVQQGAQAPAEPPPGDPQAAADRVANDQPPRTVDEANAMALAVIKQELGATVVEDDTSEVSDDGENDAPWNKKTSTVDTKPKPWETGGKPVKVADIEF